MASQAEYFAAADDPHYRWQTEPGYFADTERALIELTGLPSAGRVLEIGCGEGGNLYHLGGRPGLVGIDLSAERVRHAAARLPAVRFARSDAARLPFGDAAFDAVLIRDLLHHVPDRAAVMGEAARVLRPGGILCAIEPNRTSPLILAKALFVPAERAVLASHAGRLAAELRAAGLADVAVRRAQPLPLARALLHPRLGLSRLGARPGVARALAAVDGLAAMLVPRLAWMVLVAHGQRRQGVNA